MKFHRLTGKSLLTAATVLLLVGILMACGPADQSVQRQIGNLPQIAQDEGAEDPTPEATSTPEPATCGLTEGSYPKLDSTLASIVNKYETCELTEEEAAAMADYYKGSRVIVTIDLTTSGEDTVQDKLTKNDIGPHFQVDKTDPAFIYSFVKVSELGTVALLDGVNKVRETENIFSDTPTDTWNNLPSPSGTRSYKDGTTMPELPADLKGYEHEGSYPKIDGVLNSYYRIYLAGNLTDTIKEQDDCLIDGDLVSVTIQALDAQSTALEAYLAVNGVAPVAGSKISYEGVTHFAAWVTWPLLGELAEKEELLSVDGNTCFLGGASAPSAPTNQQVHYQSPAEVLGADHWHDHTGGSTSLPGKDFL